MTEIRSALAELLEADEKLMKLATGGVWYELAGQKGQGVEPPYVIIAKVTGTPDWAFQGDPMDWDVWLIKGVGKVKAAEQIDARCKELLTDAELVINNRRLLYLRSMGDVNYAEVEMATDTSMSARTIDSLVKGVEVSDQKQYYRVLGDAPVLGHQPGTVFTADIPRDQLKRMIDRGSLELCDAPEAVPDTPEEESTADNPGDGDANNGGETPGDKTPPVTPPRRK